MNMNYRNSMQCGTMRAIVMSLMEGYPQPALHGAFAKGRIGALDSKHLSTR
jgi:hypothetical protein